MVNSRQKGLRAEKQLIEILRRETQLEWEQTPGSGPSGVGVPAPVQRDSVVCKLGLGTVYGPSCPLDVGHGAPWPASSLPRVP